MNLQPIDAVSCRQPRLGYMHLCIAFHEDRSDSNEYILARQVITGQWIVVYGGSYVLLADSGFTIVQWMELPKLNHYDF